jgi:hypothetical protein
MHLQSSLRFSPEFMRDDNGTQQGCSRQQPLRLQFSTVWEIRCSSASSVCSLQRLWVWVVIPQPSLGFGVIPDGMKARLFTLECLLVTLGAVAAAWYAIASISLGGLSPTNWTAADIIRQRCPVHLVRAEWIRGTDQGDMLFAWAVTETKARLALVCALWLIAVGVLVWRALLQRQHGHRA